MASKYRLDARIGLGGMGAVWSASHTQTGREFAIKFLHPMVAQGSDDARHRFVQEAKASARINHPNIIDIFDVGETEDGSLYLVMELLDGLPLGEALCVDPPFNAREFLSAMTGAVTALGAAHAAGVVHRDIKPPNIFLHRDRSSGHVRTKVLDFGVSKILLGDEAFATHTGSLLGSPRYMAPEQAISAASADGRSDIWSLGVVMFEALTGTFPHEGDSSHSLVIAIAMKPAKTLEELAPHLPEGLRRLVDDCLRPAGHRIATAEILHQRMLEVLSKHDLTDVPLVFPTSAKAKARTRPANFLIDTLSASNPGQLSRSLDRVPAASPSQSQSRPNPERPVPAPRDSSNEDATLVHFLPRASIPSHVDDAAPPEESNPRASLPRNDTAQFTQEELARMAGANGGDLLRALNAAPAPEPPSVPFAPVDPGESVSSINVVRGGFDARFAVDAVPPSGPPKATVIALFVAMGALAGLALLVILIKSGSGEPKASDTQSSPVVAAVATQTAEETATSPIPDMPTAAATATAASSAVAAAPTASVTSSARPKLGVGRLPKPPTGDAVKDLGSGL